MILSVGKNRMRQVLAHHGEEYKLIECFWRAICENNSCVLKVRIVFGSFIFNNLIRKQQSSMQ